MSNPDKQDTESPTFPTHKSLDRVASQGHRDCLFTVPPNTPDNQIAPNAASPAGAAGRTALMAATGTAPSPEFLHTVIAWHRNGDDQQLAETFERNRTLNSE